MIETVQPGSAPSVLAQARRASPLVPQGAPRIALLVFLGYYAGARLGLALTFLPLPISVLWPPNAILLGAMLMVPPAAWWIVLASALPAHLLAELGGGIPLPMVLSWYASNVAEAAIGATAIKLVLRGAPIFATLRGTVVFIVSACAAAIASSFLDSALVILNRWGSASYWELWRDRTLSNTTAALVVAPLVVAWGAGARLHRPRQEEVLEIVLVATGLAAAAYVAFNVSSRSLAPFLPVPFLVWAALRFGIRGSSAAFAAIAVAAIWGAGHGIGALAFGSSFDITRSMQLFLLSMGTVLLCLAGAAEERRRAQASLADLRFRLTQASRLAAMGEMAASIAHEINQPMSAILANAEAAQALVAAGRAGDAELPAILEDIREDDLRAVRIVRQLRDIARQRAPEVRDLDLAEQLDAVLALGMHLALHRGVTVESRCERGILVRGDPIHVQHALANLIVNAMDAMAHLPKPQRRVRIQVYVLADAAQVSVRDEGHGIPPERLEQVFESFFTTKSEGMGLGLSIARTLVTAQGGRIWAENNADHGATVSFTIPLALCAAPGAGS